MSSIEPPPNAPPNSTESHHPSVPGRAQWLVSVRNLAESQSVVPFGVDILDVKEPAFGPLAPASPSIWNQIAQWNHSRGDQRLPLSAALGESDQAIALAESLPNEFDFAKVGPSGCGNAHALLSVWRESLARIPSPVELVAVAYADHQSAGCLPARQVLELAIEQGFGRILIDTFDKRSGSSVEHLATESLLEFGRLARQGRLWWALAGSITLDDVRHVNEQLSPELRPNCFAVRGDVCQGDVLQNRRTSNLSLSRLQAWSDAFSRRTSVR